MNMPVAVLQWIVALFSIATMFALGLEMTLTQLGESFRQWLAVAIIILVNNLLIPLLAVILLLAPGLLPEAIAGTVTDLLDFTASQRSGFLLVALAAGGVLGPPLVALAQANVAQAKGTTTILVLASVMLMPIEIGLLRSLAPFVLALPEGGSIFKTLLLYQLLPFAAGMALKVWYAKLADLLRPLIVQLASLTFLLLLALLPVIGYTTSAEAHLVSEPLFELTLDGVTADAINKLDQGQVPRQVATAFKRNDAALSATAWVNTKEKGTSWEIVDDAGRYTLDPISGAAKYQVSALYPALLALDPRMSTDLESGQITTLVADQFQQGGLPLSTDAQVDRLQPGVTWAIVDGDKHYFVTQQDQDLLVYAVEDYLLSISREPFGAELDDVQISPELRAALQARDVTLSPDARVAVVQPGQRWTLIDGEQRYSVAGEQQTLTVMVEPVVPQSILGLIWQWVQAQPTVVTVVGFVQQLGITVPPLIVYGVVATLLLTIGHYTGLLVNNAIDPPSNGVVRTQTLSCAVRNVSAALLVAVYHLPAAEASGAGLNAIGVILLFYTISLAGAAIRATQWAQAPETAPAAPASQSKAAVITPGRGVTSAP